MPKNHSILIAKILIFTSFIFFLWGGIIEATENKTVVDPKKAKSLNPTEEKVNITTKDDASLPNVPESSEEIVPTTPETPSTPTEENTQETPNFNVNTPPVVSSPSITDTNNNLRNTIQNNYNITIYYGNETNGYKVGGLETYVEEDEYTIQNALTSLSNTLELYPFGFFQEINRSGIPLTIYLIKNYSTKGVTGATNAFNTKADISISLEYDFADSFNHEVFHYIEKYISKQGDNFNSWNTLNPNNFKYNSINDNLSYNRTFSSDSPFVNNYAQTSSEEDRASTFEYMMAKTKASCLNKDKTVWRKADFLAQKIDLAFTTVSPNTTEYWERYLY